MPAPILSALQTRVPEFVKAYEEEGLPIADFEVFGATRRTLRQFIAAVGDLNRLVRDVLLPDPDM